MPGLTYSSEAEGPEHFNTHPHTLTAGSTASGTNVPQSCNNVTYKSKELTIHMWGT